MRETVIYGVVNSAGALCYVGKTTAFENRMQAHAKKMGESGRAVVLDIVQNGPDATAAEEAWIGHARRHGPVLNKYPLVALPPDVIDALLWIVYCEGAPSVAAYIGVSPTTVGRWLAGVLGPREAERERLDALLGRKPAGRKA